MGTQNSPESGEIQTCTNWRGGGSARYDYEWAYGATRHRWHCFDCDEKGPAVDDGRQAKEQLLVHIARHHPPAAVVSE